MATYDGDVTLSAGLDVSDVIDTAQRLNDQIEDIFSESSGVDASPKFKSLLATLDKLYTRSNDVQEKMAELEGKMSAGTAKEADYEQYDRLVTQLNQISNQTVIVRERLDSLNEVDASGPEEGLQETNSVLGRIVLGITRATGAFVEFNARLSGAVLKKAASYLQSMVKSLLQMAKNTVVSGIKKVGSAISGIGKESKGVDDVLKKAFKTFIKYGLGMRTTFTLIRKIRSAITEGFGDIAQVYEPFNTAMSNLMTAMNGLKGSISAAFAPLVEFVEPALTRFIYLVSEAVEKIGMLIAALTGKQFVRAVPVQQDYAESVADTAKNTNDASKAIKTENKEAKELKKTLASFDDINILNEDKDNNNDNDTSPLDAGLNIQQPKVEFETAPIESAFKDFVGKLKKMWEDADFTELGSIVGQKLKDALEKIPWDAIKETLNKIAKSIATFLNGFLETPGLFTVIGQTIGEALNTAFGALNTFAENFHWDSLGYAIKDGILGVANTLDWPLIYNTFKNYGNGIGTTIESALDNPEIWTAIFSTIVKGFNSIILGIDSIINAINWGSLGTNIATGLNDAVNLINWMAISDVLIDGINGVFDLWYNFVTTFDFFKFGSYIGDTLSRAINNIDWTKGGASVGATFNALLDAFNGFVTSTDWAGVGSAIIDVIAGFFEEFDWSKVGSSITAVVVALYTFLTGAIKEVDWENIPNEIAGMIGQFLEGFDWSEMASKAMEFLGAALAAAILLVKGLAEAVGEWISSGIDGAKDYFSEKIEECGGNIVAGIFKGITDAFMDVVGWIKEHIVDPFINGIKSVFGIASPATTMIEIGGYIIEGLLNGITEGLKDIATWLKEHIFDPIFNGIKSLFGIGEGESVLVSVGKDLIGGLKDGLKDAAGAAGDFIKDHVTGPITGFFKKHFGTENEGESVLTNIGTNMIDGLKNGLSTAADAAGDFIKDHVTGPITGFFKKHFGTENEDGTSALTNVGDNMIEGLKTGLQEKAESAKDFIDEHVTGPICGFFKDLFKINSPSLVFSEYGGYLMEGLETGISDNTGIVDDALDDVKSTMDKTWDGISEDTNKTWEEMNKNASEEFGKLASTTETETGNSDSSFGSHFSSSGATVTRYMTAMNNDVSKKMREIWTTVNLYNGYIETLMGAYWGKIKDTVSDALKSINTSVNNNMININTSVSTGLSSINTAINNSRGALMSGMTALANSMYSSFNANWQMLGDNICRGIYNGIVRNWNWLTTTAWNLAIDIYNSAADALDIGSPSKKFRWISEMIVAGMVDGLENSGDMAIDTTGELIQGILDKAADADPVMTLDTQLTDTTDTLSSILDNYSTTIVDNFTRLIDTLNSIANLPNALAVAQGRVIPYSGMQRSTEDSNSKLDEMIARLDNLADSAITETQLIDIIRRYLNFSFVIGDEQIARHANAGNAKLDRRFNSLK